MPANRLASLVRPSPAGLGPRGRARQAIATIANYGFDWAPGHDAEALTVEEAWLSARDSETLPRFDPASGNLTFDYEEEDGQAHHVWFLDAATAWNQLRAAHIMGVARRLALVSRQRRSRYLARFCRVPVRPAARPLDAHNPRQCRRSGHGEILRIVSTPTEGARAITTDRLGLMRGSNIAPCLRLMRCAAPAIGRASFR